MSDIERFVTIWGGGGMMPARSGDWVRYDDHRAEVERLKNNLFPWDTYDRLKNANEHLKEDVAKLTVDRDAAQAEVERMTQELDGLRAIKQRIIAERDLAQGERERLQDLLRCERQELSTLQERLRQLRSDQPAQKLDMANGQAILDSSRPTDEDIWREAFMRCVSEYVTGERRVIIADAMLAEYRKRWPR